MEYTINLIWDREAAVWVATSENVKGLVLESGSLDALIERAKIAIPELLELNQKNIHRANIYFKSERYEEVLV